MNNINLITPPDKLYNDNFEILLMYPSAAIETELQNVLLSSFEDSVNVYVYDKVSYNPKDISWVLDVFKASNIAIVDIDNTEPFMKDLLSYIVSKDKTYWLTNADDSIYNFISKQRVYTLEWLTKLGNKNAETE